MISKILCAAHIAFIGLLFKVIQSKVHYRHIKWLLGSQTIMYHSVAVMLHSVYRSKGQTILLAINELESLNQGQFYSAVL